MTYMESIHSLLFNIFLNEFNVSPVQAVLPKRENFEMNVLVLKTNLLKSVSVITS